MDILYIKIVDRKIQIHTTSGVLHGSVFVQLERILCAHGFMKIDQSKLVNMDKAKSFDEIGMKLSLENGLICSVSRSNKKKISSYFDKK